MKHHRDGSVPKKTAGSSGIRVPSPKGMRTRGEQPSPPRCSGCRSLNNLDCEGQRGTVSRVLFRFLLPTIELAAAIQNIYLPPAQFPSRAVCHGILEFSARVLDGALSRHCVRKFPFASSRERNA